MSRTPHADRGLAEDQLHDLNREFYANPDGPVAYFHKRLMGLMLLVSGDESVGRTFVSGLAIDGVVVKIPMESWDTESIDKEYAALEAENLFHQAAECLFRMLLAHRDRPPCPWLELARLRQDRAFRDRVRDEVDAADPVWQGVIADLIFQGDDPATRIGGAEQEHWEAVVMTTARVLDRVKAQFLSDDVLYNSTKHGLAVVADERSLNLLFDGAADATQVVSGMAVSYLEQRPADSKERTWHKSSRWISTKASVSLTWQLLLSLDALWLIARRRYAGFQPPRNVQYLGPDGWEMLDGELKGLPSTLVTVELPYLAPGSAQ